ncbi:MAG: zinc-dependent alcohol dehydrogenase [Acidimicrobiales bacterium]
MRALVMDGPRMLHVEERPDPEPGPGQVRVQVEAVGICGSDLHGLLGETGRRLPGTVMGHEVAGIVERSCEGGPDVGSRVAVLPVLSCGRCPPCLRGWTSQCPRARVIGVDRDLVGGYADLLCVPVENLVEMPARLSAETAALVEPLAVGMHAVRAAGVQPGERVLIAGAGMIGIAALVVALRDGASEVVVSELQAGRRATAAALGATAVEPAAVGADPAVDVSERGLFDRAIDAVGISATLRACVAATSPGATVAIVGMGSAYVELDLFALVRAERRIVGSYTYTMAHFREAARWLAQGVVSFEGLTTRRVSFGDAAAAFLELASGLDPATKGFFVPESAA